jgi:hypothetical protein
MLELRNMKSADNYFGLTLVVIRGLTTRPLAWCDMQNV